MSKPKCKYCGEEKQFVRATIIAGKVYTEYGACENGCFNDGQKEIIVKPLEVKNDRR